MVGDIKLSMHPKPPMGIEGLSILNLDFKSPRPKIPLLRIPPTTRHEGRPSWTSTDGLPSFATFFSSFAASASYTHQESA